MIVSYSPTFIRMLNSLPFDLQEEIIEKLEMFHDVRKHRILKVHKLKGRLKGRYSFSVNYRVRVVFIYTKNKPKEAFLLAVGDHDLYR